MAASNPGHRTNGHRKRIGDRSLIRFRFSEDLSVDAQLEVSTRQSAFHCLRGTHSHAECRMFEDRLEGEREMSVEEGQRHGAEGAYGLATATRRWLIGPLVSSALNRHPRRLRTDRD